MKVRCQKSLFSFVIGILGAIALFQTLSVFETTGRTSVVYSNSFLSLIFCIFSVVLYQKAYEKFLDNRKVQTRVALVYSLALSVALNAG